MTVDFTTLANPGVLKLNPYQAGKPIEELQRETGIHAVIKLASNENPLGPSQKAMDAVKTCLLQLHRYPDAEGYALKKALAEHLHLLPNTLILGNGSDNILALIAQAFLQPQDEVLLSQYGFATFAIVTHAAGGTPITIPAKNFGADLDAIAKAITPKTRLIFIANPNNPTGTWFNEEALNAFLKKVPQEVIVVMDEAYAEFAIDPSFPHTLKFMEAFPNLIVTRTFSKIYGLAGLRVGYGVAHKSLSDLLNRIRLPFNVSIPAQIAAIAALSDQEHLQKTIAMTEAGRIYLSNGLQHLGLQPIPSATNFLTVDMGLDGLTVYAKLLEDGLIVRPLTAYGLPQHLRITIGLPEENAKFLASLEKILYSLKESC